jgi:hypothetical protein
MSGWMWVGVVATLGALVFGVYLSSTAGRLGHLHRRIDTSCLVLDAQLLRRSSVTIEIASSGLPLSERALAESDLTGALLAALGPDDVDEVGLAGGEDMLEELDAACRRVQLSRRFLNDAVRACRQVRRQRMVRLFRLAGHTPWPDTWEMDDTIPEGLVRR